MGPCEEERLFPSILEGLGGYFHRKVGVEGLLHHWYISTQRRRHTQ